MPKLIKDLLIVPPNEVYPVQLRAHDECPDWALNVAEALGILEKLKTPKKAPANKAMAAPENKGGK
ncbi:hypothetical protein [Paracoccus sp. SSK6]|uniref:hypothetical protein n=1 Tax=Paracoccus sp. SSK6 TaxID=3143131 RepID=UPI00321B60E1